ncbi:hypothetical protein C8R43DRAFT_1121808 [Mycena crocata]|nr:hypothetical protein C8R43DRAFT_1121808 [Mycena crocata]
MARWLCKLTVTEQRGRGHCTPGAILAVVDNKNDETNNDDSVGVRIPPARRDDPSERECLLCLSAPREVGCSVFLFWFFFVLEESFEGGSGSFRAREDSRIGAAALNYSRASLVLRSRLALVSLARR